MFGNSTVSPNAIRKYTAYFGTIFSDVWLKRFDETGTQIQEQKVPLNYGPRDKFLARADGNPDLERKVAIQLPRMSFELKTFYYDITRKLSPLNRILAANGNGGYNYQYQPIPYNFVFELNIMVKNIEDGLYILEQILPNFQPTWQAKLNLGDSPDTQIDVPITLNDNTHTDTYEGSFIDRRAIIWTLTFTMNGYVFQPTKDTDRGIIKQININLFNTSDVVAANNTNTFAAEHIEVIPGQFANGQPTSVSIPLWEYRIANSTASFYPTEVINDGENFAYVASANSTIITTRNVKGTLGANTVIYGEYGSSAIITNVLRKPPQHINYNNVEANSSYGIITTFTSNINSESIPEGFPLLPNGYRYVVDDNGNLIVDVNGDVLIAPNLT